MDVETTGTKPRFHELTELGVRHTELGYRCWQIAPRHMERAQPEALSISRYNSSDWADAKEFRHIVDEITPFFEDATIVGHNAALFDIPMLQGEYEMAGLPHDHLFRDVIDTMALARTHLVPLGLNRLGLGACMKFIGEDYDGAHNAYDDTIMHEKLYYYIVKNLKWHGKVNGKYIQDDLFD